MSVHQQDLQQMSKIKLKKSNQSSIHGYFLKAVKSRGDETLEKQAAIEENKDHDSHLKV